MNLPVDVTSTAAAVFTPQTNTQTALLFNAGNVPVYLGQSGVTAATGWPLQPGQQTSTAPGFTIYAVCASGQGAPLTVTY